MNLLIIEDDSTIRSGLKYCLECEGFNVIEASLGSEALTKLDGISLILLDINLPDINGFDLFNQIKSIKDVPVIFLTANDLETSIVMGLDMGADDYITKPFSVNELLVRIRVNLRRNKSEENLSDKIVFQDIELDLVSRDITFKNEKLKLTPIEYELLKYFILNANKTLTHKQILQEVWGTGHQNEMPYLRTYVNTLRKKIEENSTRPTYIKTISGVGYRFSCENS